MSVVTRFAPSPTGYLHIGSARTALFNWLFSRHHGGKFLLRIEDTDRARSTPDAVRAILDGLSWLELNWDDEVVYQFSRIERHAAVAHELLAKGRAYKCFATPQELEAMRQEARAAGRSMRYDGRWRDRDPSEAPAGAPYVIRLRAPTEGATTVTDLVQGEITVDNVQLDDMVLLRSDGTPTYMHSVVVDDRDMAITHVIRGDDHLTNTFRQKQLYEACGWPAPTFAHIPLIHGPDGAKLSKRHGALGVEAYRDMGYLPEALRNYLLRLGWAHGDEEIIPTERAVAWFDLDAVGRSPARFDIAKLQNLNGHYIRERRDAELTRLVAPALEAALEAPLTAPQLGRLEGAMPGLKARAKTLVELVESAKFYVASRPLPIDPKAAALLTSGGRATLRQLAPQLLALADWSAPALEAAVRSFVAAQQLKLGDAAQPLRAALTGSLVSPPIFEVMAVLGRDETLARLADQGGD
ncbi:MAG: glutamate--tRNA ligase [Proteobacteria bacterium]|nr:glutamate--tRNA ligase [Pseudomonadota bacterium]